MRRARVAEWLLQAVTTPERAASTAGDLVETAQERGHLWFWSNLLRTSWSQMWRLFIDTPQLLGQLVFRTWCMGLVYLLCYTLLRAVADVMSISFDGHPLTGNLSWMISRIGTIVTQILMGRWIARRAPERAMSAGLALCLYTWVLAIGLAIGLSIGHLRDAPLTGPQWIFGAVQSLFYTLPFLAGVLLAPRPGVERASRL